MNLFESWFRIPIPSVISLYRALFDFYRLIGRRIDSSTTTTLYLSPGNFPKWNGIALNVSISRDSISSPFGRIVFFFLFYALHVFARLDRKNRREGKKKTSCRCVQYRGVEDRGDLINIEEILGGLGSDYSFEEIFRREMGGGANFSPLKGRRSEKRERKRRKTQDGRNSDQLFPPRGLVEYA